MTIKHVKIIKLIQLKKNQNDLSAGFHMNGNIIGSVADTTVVQFHHGNHMVLHYNIFKGCFTTTVEI